jgi:8-oxo-dGTP diphosphatase
MKLQVGVKILVQNDNDEFLLLERAGSMPSDGGRYWDIPGGRINENEPLLKALGREVEEETGLRLNSEPELLCAQDIFVEKADLHVVRLTYRGKAAGEVTVSEEHSSYKWVDEKELLSENIDPYVRTAIEKNERI